MAQGIIATLLTFIFLLMPTVSSAFWILTVLVAQLYLIMYLFMFAAVIRLRYTQPEVPRAYKIPGGRIGIWLVAGIGTLIGSLFALLVGYIPPEQIKVGSSRFYVIFLIIGTVIGCIFPLSSPLLQKKTQLELSQC